MDLNLAIEALEEVAMGNIRKIVLIAGVYFLEELVGTYIGETIKWDTFNFTNFYMIHDIFKIYSREFAIIQTQTHKLLSLLE